MRVSAKSDYALRALIEMAGRADGKAVSAEELGRLQEIPHGFLQAILADLRRAGIVMSQRGQSGGWRMGRPADGVTVAAVVRPGGGRLGQATVSGRSRRPVTGSDFVPKPTSEPSSLHTCSTPMPDESGIMCNLS